MSFTALLTQQVTITTVTASGVKDAYGNPKSTTATQTVSGRVDQVQTVENVDGRDVTVTRDVLYLTPDVTISATSRVTVGGVTYAVDGRPNVVQGARAAHHLEVPLRAISDA